MRLHTSQFKQPRISSLGERSSPKLREDSEARGAKNLPIARQKMKPPVLLPISMRLKRQSSEQGLTLLESLVAVLLVSSIIVAITPAIFLSAATHVRNRRAEQATQLAQAEVDKIRRLLERGNYTRETLDNSNPNNPYYVPQVAGGNSELTTVAVGSFREVDIDGNGSPDFLVQTFRNEGISLPNQELGNLPHPVEFQMGVRVYSILAKGNSLLFDRRANLQLTTGDGGVKNRPLAMFYTRMSRSDLSNSACSYFRAGGQQPPAGCP